MDSVCVCERERAGEVGLESAQKRMEAWNKYVYQGKMMG